VIFVGLQGSGKTTYYRRRFAATHVHVSKDLMTSAKSREARQRHEIGEALAAGRSVVVDNTNPTVWDRAPLLALGRAHGARIVAYYFEADVKQALMRNRGREGKARVPDVAIFTTRKRLVPPTLEEGFDEVVVVPYEVA